MITPFTYFCNLKGNYDGDSVTLDIDLGCSAWLLGEKTRLYGIDTPEIRGPNRELGAGSRDPKTKLI